MFGINEKIKYVHLEMDGRGPNGPNYIINSRYYPENINLMGHSEHLYKSKEKAVILTEPASGNLW